MKLATWMLGGAVSLAGATAWAGAADKRLDIYWVDVEGGAATLLVTPAGESVLIDTGYPGERDPVRVHKAATELAGLKKIDHLVITHFHGDHYGGVADIAKRIPVGTLYTRPLESAPEKERNDKNVPALKDAQVERRVTIKPGAKLPLKQAKGAAKLTFTFLGATETFVGGGKDNTEACKAHTPKPPDMSDNKNSAVMLVTFGSWRFFDGGDLTWNTEAALVCPKDRVGPVDLFQINHHGLDSSNNPVLVKTLSPTVTVVNNGPRKGGEPGTFATLKATPSIQAIYQVHRNVRVGPEQNTAPELTANTEEACAGNHVKASVDPQGKTYTVSVPATNHERVYQVRASKQVL